MGSKRLISMYISYVIQYNDVYLFYASKIELNQRIVIIYISAVKLSVVHRKNTSRGNSSIPFHVFTSQEHLERNNLLQYDR